MIKIIDLLQGIYYGRFITHHSTNVILLFKKLKEISSRRDYVKRKILECYQTLLNQQMLISNYFVSIKKIAIYQVRERAAWSDLSSTRKGCLKRSIKHEIGLLEAIYQVRDRAAWSYLMTNGWIWLKRLSEKKLSLRGNCSNQGPGQKNYFTS